MEKHVVILGICLLLLLLLPLEMVSAGRPMANPYTVVGRVYCDTCRSGFETPLTSYIADAKVRLECRHRSSEEVLYGVEGTTDSSGTYKMMVYQDQGDRVCDAVLVSSPMSTCGKPDPGRDRSRVILTDYNGIVSRQRFANALGFVQDSSLAACTRVLQQYQLNQAQN